MLLCLIAVMTTPGQCPTGGCGTAVYVSRHCGAIHSPNAHALLYPSGAALQEIGPNWAWFFPYGGVTLYPGEPGSGYAARSDYSCINWIVTPEQNANMVRGRLRSMGIPDVPPEPLFWGKNPSVTDSIQALPRPRPRTAEPPPVDPKDKPE
jgi:hypothetical protein